MLFFILFLVLAGDQVPLWDLRRERTLVFGCFYQDYVNIVQYK